MREVKCPQINVNDNLYVINELFFNNGEFIKEGDIVASISSSKVVNDVESDYSGYISYAKKVSDEISFGDNLAYVFETKEEYDIFMSKIGSAEISEKEVSPEYVLTKPAQTFVQEYNISEAQIKGLNKKIVKTEDLRVFVNVPSEGMVQKLTHNQAITASKVIQSHNEIPQAFQVMKIDCSKCEKLVNSFSEEYGITIGYAEIIVTILSELFEDFPYIFGRYTEGNMIKLSVNPEIGVTIDVGSGLFLPVIKSKKSMSLEEVTDRLFEYKMKAADNSFEEEDLTGGNISVSLNPLLNMVFVEPIIFPEQGAMISVCSPIKELHFDENKNVVEKSFLYVGIAFDHRIINGSYAMEFLGKISQKLENIDFAIKR